MPYGQNNSTNWPAIWRRKRWFGQAFKIGIRIFEYNPEKLDQDLVAIGGTFVRATTASYYKGAAGANAVRTIHFAAAGQIRDKHWTGWRDISTDEPLRQGALIEKAGTNYATFSETFTNPAWTEVGLTLTGDSEPHPVEPAEPDAGDKAEDDGSTGKHYVGRTFNISGDFAFSIFVKRLGAGQKIKLKILANGSDANSGELTFDGTDLEVATKENGTCKIVAAGTDRNIQGWHRLMLGVNDPAATSYEVRVMLLDPAGDESYTGVVGRGFNLWGAQAEASGFSTSYIRSLVGALGQRDADVLYFQWPLTTQAVEMSVLDRFQDLGTYATLNGTYDHLGSTDPTEIPYLDRQAMGGGAIQAEHRNSKGSNAATGPQTSGFQSMVSSMTRLYDTGAIQLEQSVEGAATSKTDADALALGLESWAGAPSTRTWIGGVNGARMGAVVLFQLRMVDNPNATFITDQKPQLLAKGLKINPSDNDYAFVEDQAKDVFFDELDPDAMPGYAVVVDADTNALLIEEELGYYFIDDGV